MPSLEIIQCRHTIISSAAGGVQAIAAAPAGVPPNAPLASWKTRIYRIVIGTVGGAATLTLQDTSAASIMAPWVFAAATTFPFVIETPTSLESLAETAAGLGAQLNVSAAVQVNADIYWLQGP
jgi:hypothetical protein